MLSVSKMPRNTCKSWHKGRLLIGCSSAAAALVACASTVQAQTILDLVQDISILQSQMVGVQGDITTIQADFGALQSTVTINTNDLLAHTVTLSALGTQVTANSSAITVNAANITDQGGTSHNCRGPR